MVHITKFPSFHYPATYISTLSFVHLVHKGEDYVGIPLLAVLVESRAQIPAYSNDGTPHYHSYHVLIPVTYSLLTRSHLILPLLAI